jgi:hypothetical protein
VTPEAAQALRELRSGGPIYAVLDAARDGRVGRLIVDGAPAWCLYRGEESA